MLFQRYRPKKSTGSIPATGGHIEAGIAPKTPSVQDRQHNAPAGALGLNDADREELEALRTAIKMMGLDPKKVAARVTIGYEPMELVYARILFSSLEPSVEKLRKHAGEETNIKTWLQAWQTLS